MKTILGGTTPICISYRRSADRPVLKHKRRFVGFRQLVQNAIDLISDTFDSLAFETEETLVLGEDSVSVHWALEIDDPWGSNPESSIVAVRVPEVPPAGQHFEIFKIDPSLKKPDPDEHVDPADEKQTVAKRSSAMNNEDKGRLRTAIMNHGLYDPEAGVPEL